MNCSAWRMFSPYTSFGLTASQMPAARSACSAALPYGACRGLPMAIFRIAGSVSCSRPVSFGPRRGVASTMRPCAYRVRVLAITRSFAASASTYSAFAAKKTSAGAPASIWCAKFPVDPRTRVTFEPVARSNAGTISLNANARSDAAKTVSVGAAETAATIDSTRAATIVKPLMPRERSGRPAPIQTTPVTPPADAALLDPGEQPVHQKDEREQQERERDRQLEVAFARLQHHRGRQRARLALDVAAD